VYFSPYFDATGYHYPLFADIRDFLIGQATAIFGADSYLEPDSQEYEAISIEALARYDAYQSIEQAYLNQSPVTASGIGLSSRVAWNGLTRLPASFSTCDVTLTGTAYALITGGIVGDANGNNWALPSPLTIPIGGSLTVTATSQTSGAINAAAATLTSILTPTAGWVSVTNANAATPGQPQETDAQLKARQAISTELPSNTLLAGTKAALKVVPDVTRSEVYENDTDSADSNGLDPHSIWAVVEGGDVNVIAQAIYDNKGPGCGLNGTTTVVLTLDAVHAKTASVKFSRPGSTSIYATIEYTALANWNSAMATAIHAAILLYLNSLSIGEKVTRSALFAIAMSICPDIYNPAFSITAVKLGTSATPTGTADITITFDHVCASTTDKIIVQVTP
jgi:uncharacterized phage protein gp47/JayE